MSRCLPPDPNATAGAEVASPDVLARRRFVRGVFAAPAVMTVCSGSAYAAAVSATCLVRAQRADPVGVSAYSTASTASDSTFLRVRVHELNGVKYVRYGDLTMIGFQGVASPVPGNVGPDDYLELNDTGGLTGNVLRTQGSTAAAAPGATSNAVVVRFDERGYVVGTGTHGSLGALASMACLMSVTP